MYIMRVFVYFKACVKDPFRLIYNVKGTVQRELRWVKIGIYRTARINCIAGKCHFPCPKGHHHESIINVIFLAAVVLFDANQTGWVSKHNSVGLIPLQRRYSDAVAAKRRSIPKCYVKWSLWSLQRRYSDAVAL